MKMIYKNILFLLLFLSLSFVQAQVTIYNSHYFKEGLTVRYQPTLDSLVVYEDPGENLIWNYAQLTKNGDAYSRKIKSSADTPLGTRFLEANVAIVGQDNGHVYLNVRKDRTEFIAFVPPDTSYVVHNYLPWTMSIHPMMLGDSLTAPIGRYIKVGDRTVYRDGTVMLSAIGSGKLVLPLKTYEKVLKIKEVQTFYNPSRTTFYQATTYHWLSNRHNFPVLSCNEIIDRNSKGEEKVTRFAQYILSETNTSENTTIKEMIQHIKKVKIESSQK